MLRVTAFQHVGKINPRMVVQRAIVIVAKELVQIDVKKPVSRNYPPPLQIRMIGAAYDEIGRAGCSQFLEPAHANQPALKIKCSQPIYFSYRSPTCASASSGRPGSHGTGARISASIVRACSSARSRGISTSSSS